MHSLTTYHSHHRLSNATISTTHGGLHLSQNNKKKRMCSQAIKYSLSLGRKLKKKAKINNILKKASVQAAAVS
jgi:hypothetical protein